MCLSLYLILIKRSDLTPHLEQVLGGVAPCSVKPQTVHCHLRPLDIVFSLLLLGFIVKLPVLWGSFFENITHPVSNVQIEMPFS